MPGGVLKAAHADALTMGASSQAEQPGMSWAQSVMVGGWWWLMGAGAGAAAAAAKSVLQSSSAARAARSCTIVRTKSMNTIASFKLVGGPYKGLGSCRWLAKRLVVVRLKKKLGSSFMGAKDIAYDL